MDPTMNVAKIFFVLTSTWTFIAIVLRAATDLVSKK